MSQHIRASGPDNEILSEILQMLSEQDRQLPVTPFSALEDIGLDSFSLLSLALSIEQRFDIELDNEELQTFRKQTPESLVILILRKQAPQPLDP